MSEEKGRAKIACRMLENVVRDFGLELNKYKTELVDLGSKGVDYLAYRIDERKNLTISHRSWGKLKKELEGSSFKRTIKLRCPVDSKPINKKWDKKSLSRQESCAKLLVVLTTILPLQNIMIWIFLKIFSNSFCT